ncbi:ENTH-domain-containing protein [Aureobasidium pullulans]|uniref:ENTH-domain-containing protein n=1 Tax=Aureobasidium pullulans TaxID=5580 RepID=A0A4V6T8K1_AURPU|nr:ENTH-domain-containing protein [Aureobasidium pullulans]THW20624.1 ENTH-domain-containing protein [Aureobasidium pullulans]THW59873.1 ENTH-domain-containing protein [Aureobasidium pullulans]
MDFDSLKNQVSNLTLYDLKAGVRKVQNAVMNYTEMESKVREATNNEPWGASTTMMNDIASGTFNYQILNEIMPMIYKRFTEKTAEEWRQIYKALQLLEFLIKNGSERVIDDVRSHLSLIKMLRQFHYIDQNGKDQGINVRNRSKELTELLSDVDRIRSERKKARQNKNKYSGVEGGAGLGGSMSTSSSRYGGFGSESAPGGYGGATRQVYGDGGGFGGETVQDDWEERSQSRSRGQDRFDEYDEYDEGGAAAPPRRKAEPSRTGTKTSTAAAKKPEPPKPKEPEVDLFDFGDEPTTLAAPSMPAMSSNGKQPADDGFGALQSGGADDDDFDDFQSAAPAAAPAPALAAAPKPNYTPNYTAIAPPVSTATPNTQFAQPQPRQGTNNAAFSNLFSTTSPVTGAAAPPPQNIASPMSAGQPRAGGFSAAQPNYFTSVNAAQSQPASTVASPGVKSPIGGAPKPKASGDAFAALLSGSNIKKSGTPSNKGPTMADMAKQKASAGIWGTTTSSTPASPAAPQNGGQKTGGAMDDLLG